MRVECKSPYYYLCGMTKCNCIIACIIDDQHHVINAIEHEQSIVVDRGIVGIYINKSATTYIPLWIRI